MNTIRIAFRNLTRQKKRSILLGGAVGFGIFVVSLLSSLTGGLVKSLQENLSQLLAGHIYIMGSELSDSGREISLIRDDTLLTLAIEELDAPVQYITKRSSVQGTLIFGSREQEQRIDGIDWESESYFRSNLMLTRGSLEELSNPRALILSENSARKLGIEIGETLLVRLTTATGQQNVDEFKLIATTIDQSIMSTMTGYAHLAYINELLNIEPDEYQSLNIYLEDIESIDRAAEDLYSLMAEYVQMAPREAEDDTEELEEENSGHRGGFGRLFRRDKEETWEGTRYSITTLNDIMSGITDFVVGLNIFSLIVLGILLIIVMVGITNTFQMILIERVREIGTMRALGMQRESVRNSFLLEALFVCLIGAFVGLLISFLAMGGLSLLSFSTDTPLFILLNNGHPAFVPQPGQLVLYVVLIAFFSLLAALFPAYKAAKLHPAKALGTHY